MNEDIEVYNDFKASEPILKVRNLKKYFPVGGIGKNKKYLRAVDDVSFDVYTGRTVGIVAESG